MKITKLHIQNYKSIKDLELINPKPFSVFVGPNGAGKSNIFEALEFGTYLWQNFDFEPAARPFGGINDISNKTNPSNTMYWGMSFGTAQFFNQITYHNDAIHRLSQRASGNWNIDGQERGKAYFENAIGDAKAKENLVLVKDLMLANQFFNNFSRIFLKQRPFGIYNDQKLETNGNNLNEILRQILLDENKSIEVIEWMREFVPEFENIEVKKDELDGTISFSIYEKHTKTPFPKRLISDGTRNILSLLAAVYQSDEPQFLCIEEPENGLHPHVIRDLVSLFRSACEDKGHYIWLNTHSETLVRQLRVDEIIVVDKKNGATQAKQFQGRDVYGLQLDEAWLTNMLGGGLP